MTEYFTVGRGVSDMLTRYPFTIEETQSALIKAVEQAQWSDKMTVENAITHNLIHPNDFVKYNIPADP